MTITQIKWKFCLMVNKMASPSMYSREREREKKKRYPMFNRENEHDSFGASMVMAFLAKMFIFE